MRLFAWAPLMILSGCALPPLLLAGDSGDRVQYVGGTVAVLPGKTEGMINLTDEEALLFRSGDVTVRIPYQQINILEYGQRVGRRYAEAVLLSPMFLLAKKRRHYLTIGFTDENGRQQAMVLQVGKGEIRSLLVSLEARTGRRVEYQDEEARKTGKG